VENDRQERQDRRLRDADERKQQLEAAQAHMGESAIMGAPAWNA
jgi:hypothetical protein